MKRRAFPIVLCAICLLVLIGLLGLLFALLSAPPPAVQAEAPAVLYLDEGWAGRLLACRDKKAKKTFIDETLEQAGVWGCQAILLTGPAGGLFVEDDGALAPAPGLDGLDVLDRLRDQCARKGLALYLLATDTAGTPLPQGQAPAWAQALAEKDAPLVLYAGQAPGFTTPLRGAEASYTDGESLTLLDGVSPAGLAALRQAGQGGVLGKWADLVMDDSPAALLAAFSQPGQALPDTSVSQTAAICYPADGAALYTDTLCLTGTSDPAQPLTLNGQEVARPGSQGVWTSAVTLAEGTNTFTLAQGETVQTITVEYKTSSNWQPTPPESDGTVRAEPGQWVRVSADGIASLLADYGDASTILGTIPQGAVARVADSAEFLRSSKMTWAYQLLNGGWLRATDVELLDEGDAAAAPAAFDALTCAQSEKGEVWTLQGTGSPLYMEERDEAGGLTLMFYDARFAGQPPAAQGLVKGVELESLEAYDGFYLHFDFSPEEPLWGYTVRYTEAGVEILLKRAPALSQDRSAPLTGVTLLLDAGHGGDDTGASGCAGENGPVEKDLNLALALAAKTRLEQLGASVTLTRAGDDTLTLAQRLDAVNQQAPDFFISLHHNSIVLTRDTSDIHGTECFWFTPQSQPLAAALTARFASAFDCNDRGAKEDYYFVTRTTACPAVLLESGFVTTALEYERCAAPTGIWAEGGAVAEAVLSLLQEGQ